MNEANATFRLAMAQMRVAGGLPDLNLSRAGSLIAEAAGNGADIVLLPEALDLGWGDPCAADLAQGIPGGASSGALCRAAFENRVWVCAGIVEREGDHIYNSAMLIDRAGAIPTVHRKVNELDFARELYTTGESAGVVETEFGPVGVMICADAFIENHTVSRLCGFDRNEMFSPSATRSGPMSL